MFAVSPRLVLPLPSQIIDVTEGDSVWIDCIAEGDPEPKTKWDRNLSIITVFNNGESVANGDSVTVEKHDEMIENERYKNYIKFFGYQFNIFIMVY